MIQAEVAPAQFCTQCVQNLFVLEDLGGVDLPCHVLPFPLDLLHDPVLNIGRK
jgi:hypothetical protein